jgi:colanic acid/amylovoran biosynthesis protein
LAQQSTQQSKPFRILILDNVVINGGDAAIVLAMKESLEEAFAPDAEVRNEFNGVNATLETLQSCYPELQFFPTISGAVYHWQQPVHRIDRRLVRKTAPQRFLLQARLKRMGLPLSVLLPRERAVFDEYLAADLIVISGGAVLSTSWSAPRAREERILKYRMVQELGKPLVFYAQSIGPFQPDDPMPQLLKPIFERATAVLCRDAAAYQVVREQIGLHTENVYQTIDEALLLAPRQPARAVVPPRKKPIRIGVCVHQWGWLGESDPQARQRDFEARMGRVCTALLERGDTELLLLTTHQGVEGSPDDTPVSERIAAQIPAAWRGDAQVVSGFVHPREFAYEMGNCDLAISSRLHGGILSMVGGTPAILLAYEPKARGLMEQIDLTDWVLSMGDSPAEEILALAQKLLQDLPATRLRLQKAMEQGRARARQNREIVARLLARPAESRENAAVPAPRASK